MIKQYFILHPSKYDFVSDQEWLGYKASEEHPIWAYRLTHMANLLIKYKDEYFGEIDIDNIALSLEQIADQMDENLVCALVIGSEGLTFENMRDYKPLEHVDLNELNAYCLE